MGDTEEEWLAIVFARKGESTILNEVARFFIGCKELVYIEMRSFYCELHEKGISSVSNITHFDFVIL